MKKRLILPINNNPMNISHLLLNRIEKELLAKVRRGEIKLKLGDERFIVIEKKASELKKQRKKAFKDIKSVYEKELFQATCPYCDHESSPMGTLEEALSNISQWGDDDDHYLCDKCMFPIEF